MLRPTNTLLKAGSATEKKVQQIEYGTSASLNNIGQVENIYAQDGKTNFFEYDFKGNLLSLKKKFAVDYQNVLDYNGTVALQTEEFITETSFDALNRPITITQPDSTVITNIYNKGGLLEQVKEGTTSYISEINYNARGQRTEVYYGNGSKTVYTYDDENFRLERLLTTRNSGNDILMDLNYSYDSVGNIIQITNDAEREHYFDNTVVSPTATYEYDALYRLIEATGRELTSLQLPSNTDFVNNIPVPNTGTNAMQTYTQQYAYDELGNITQMKSVGDWTRDYIYDTSTNQLLRHTGSTNVYTYDAHGNMLTMPHLISMVWDFKDQLISAGNGTVTSYYNYDSQGERSRKIVVKPGGIVEERYYVGGFEVYRKYVNSSLDTERETVHIMDDRDRFAMIDTLTVENGVTLTTPVETLRYQYSNHLGSASLELDSSANIISYEEYHPFGTTSYRAGSSETEVALKRYKYVGKERDEETGLYYYGARYYAAWLCRFVSVDPLQHKYPYYTPYQYAGNKPITYIDLDGLEEWKPESQEEMRDNTTNVINTRDPRVSSTNNSGSNYSRTEQVISGILNIAAGLSLTVSGFTLAAGTSVSVVGIFIGVGIAIGGLTQVAIGISQLTDASTNGEIGVPNVGGGGELIGYAFAEKTGNEYYRLGGTLFDLFNSVGFGYTGVPLITNTEKIIRVPSMMERTRNTIEFASDVSSISSTYNYCVINDNINSIVTTNESAGLTFSNSLFMEMNRTYLTIAEGDTYGSISDFYNISIEDLLKINNIDDPLTPLIPGQDIIVNESIRIQTNSYFER